MDFSKQEFRHVKDEFFDDGKARMLNTFEYNMRATAGVLVKIFQEYSIRFEDVIKEYCGIDEDEYGNDHFIKDNCNDEILYYLYNNTLKKRFAILKKACEAYFIKQKYGGNICKNIPTFKAFERFCAIGYEEFLKDLIKFENAVVSYFKHRRDMNCNAPKIAGMNIMFVYLAELVERTCDDFTKSIVTYISKELDCPRTALQISGKLRKSMASSCMGNARNYSSTISTELIKYCNVIGFNPWEDRNIDKKMGEFENRFKCHDWNVVRKRAVDVIKQDYDESLIKF